jgi:hypothetical protein
MLTPHSRSRARAVSHTYLSTRAEPDTRHNNPARNMVAVLVTPVSLTSAPRAVTRSLRAGAPPARAARAVSVRASAEERQVRPVDCTPTPHILGCSRHTWRASVSLTSSPRCPREHRVTLPRTHRIRSRPRRPAARSRSRRLPRSPRSRRPSPRPRWRCSALAETRSRSTRNRPPR